MVKISLPVSSRYPVTQDFGANPDIYKRFGKPGHNGVDFGCPVGTEVRAAADGRVKKIGVEPDGYGNYLALAHDGFVTLYAHLSRVVVSVGEFVTVGGLIAYSGDTGFSTGPHLHFELRIPGHPNAYNRGEVNPLQFVAAQEQPPEGTPKARPGKYVVTVSALNIRSEPSLAGAVLGTLTYGAQVEIEDCDQPAWAMVKGYVSRYYLREVGGE